MSCLSLKVLEEFKKWLLPGVQTFLSLVSLEIYILNKHLFHGKPLKIKQINDREKSQMLVTYFGPYHIWVSLLLIRNERSFKVCDHPSDMLVSSNPNCLEFNTTQIKCIWWKCSVTISIYFTLIISLILRKIKKHSFMINCTS